MTKKILYIVYKCLKILDKIFFILFKKSFLIYFSDFFQEDSYKTVVILNNKINFFVPNQLTNWRIDTFFSKNLKHLIGLIVLKKKKILFLGHWSKYWIIFDL